MVVGQEDLVLLG